MQDRKIWLISDGRSGSTWFAGVLASVHGWHVEQEPIHALFNPRLAAEALLPLPGSAPLETLYLPLLRDVLAGRYRGERFGSAPAEPGGTIVRDIHALGIAPALLPAFPDVKPVLLVRDPLAVARSKLALEQWHWFDDIERLQRDPLLFPLFHGRRAWLETADTRLRRYVLVWAVCHRWFCDHVAPQRLTVVRYPLDPHDAVAACEAILGTPLRHDSAAIDRLMQAFAARSRTDRPPRAPDPWRTRAQKWITRMKPAPADHAPLDDRQWTDGVIAAFGLSHLVVPAAEPGPALSDRRSISDPSG